MTIKTKPADKRYAVLRIFFQNDKIPAVSKIVTADSFYIDHDEIIEQLIAIHWGYA